MFLGEKRNIVWKHHCHSSILKTILGQNFICRVRVLMHRASLECVQHILSVGLRFEYEKTFIIFLSEVNKWYLNIFSYIWRNKNKWEFRVSSSTWLDLSSLFKNHIQSLFLFIFVVFLPFRIENDKNIQNNLKRFIILIFGTDSIQLCNRTDSLKSVHIQTKRNRKLNKGKITFQTIIIYQRKNENEEKKNKTLHQDMSFE